MIGLIAFGSIAVWLVVSLWIAWRVARFAKLPWLKTLVILVIAPLLVVAPLADEIIGKYQFERYCESAKEVKIYGTIAVGEELYTPDGKWRLDDFSKMPLEEFNRLNKLVESLIRWDRGPIVPTRVPGIVPFDEYQYKLYGSKNGQLLADWVEYTNAGGWLKRNSGIGGATGGFLLQQSCRPTIVRENQLMKRILPTHRNVGGKP